MALKELIFNIFYFGCGGLKRTDFNRGGCGGLESIEF